MYLFFAPILMSTLLLAGDDKAQGYLGVQIKKDADGIVIQAIVGDSPADKAGLKRDDIIVKLNGDVVDALQDFVKKIGEAKPGDEIKLLIKRDGQDKEIKVKLGKKPDSGRN